MNRCSFAKACNTPTNKHSQKQANPPTTNPLLHEDTKHINLGPYWYQQRKNIQTQSEKSCISVIIDASYDNKTFRLT